MHTSGRMLFQTDIPADGRVRFNFSKMIREFFVKTTAKLHLNVGRRGWARKKIFHSILLKTTLNSIFKQLKQKMTECEKR